MGKIIYEYYEKKDSCISINKVIAITLLLFVLYKKSKDNRFNQQQMKEVRTYAEGFLEAYHNKDNNIKDFLKDKSTLDFSGYNSLLAEQFEYVVTDIEEVDSRFKVTVKITNVSIGDIFDNIIKSNDANMTEEDIQHKIENEILNNKAIQKEYECCFYVVPDGDGYYVIVTEELSNAMYGGFNNYYKSMIEKQFEEAQE